MTFSIWTKEAFWVFKDWLIIVFYIYWWNKVKNICAIVQIRLCYSSSIYQLNLVKGWKISFIKNILRYWEKIRTKKSTYIFRTYSPISVLFSSIIWKNINIPGVLCLFFSTSIFCCSRHAENNTPLSTIPTIVDQV